MLSAKKKEFLRQNIRQIKTAIVHCPDDDFYNLQSVIGRVVDLDNQGFLWIAVDKPVDCSKNGASSFDVVLNYHEKGIAFDIDILGEAIVLAGNKEIENVSPKAITEIKKGNLILRVHILDVDYWQSKKPVLKSIAQRLRYMFSSPHKESDKQIYADHQMSA